MKALDFSWHISLEKKYLSGDKHPLNKKTSFLLLNEKQISLIMGLKTGGHSISLGYWATGRSPCLAPALIRAGMWVGSG